MTQVCQVSVKHLEFINEKILASVTLSMLVWGLNLLNIFYILKEADNNLGG